MGGYSAVMDMPGGSQLGYVSNRKTTSYVVLRKRERALAYACAAEFRHSLKVACRQGCGSVVLENDAALLEQHFRELSDRWQRETAHMSSPLQRMMHQSYQTILGLGALNAERKQDVIRLMLRDIKRNRRDWFLALTYLTGENPVDAKDAGKTDKIIQSWLRWGRSQGLLEG